MAITSSVGLGSGIDINTLVTQLVSSEGQPAFNAIQRQQNVVNARLSGLGTLKSALSDFQSVVSKLKDGNLFKTHAASSSDESVLKVTAGVGSVAGSHSIEVTSLATSQKFVSAKFDANDPLDAIGAGSVDFAQGSKTFSVSLDGSTNSLSSLRDAINSNSDNTFVTASIINVDYPPLPDAPIKTVAKLVLTAKNPGTANSFTVSASDSDGDSGMGLSRLFQGTETAATDAVISVDGETATRSTNTMTDVLQGITLDLQAAKPGSNINVNVSLDKTAINKTLSDFVTAYNKLHTTAKDLGKYGGSTDGSGSGNGALIGDSTLRYVTSQIRQDAANKVTSTTGSYDSLAMIGIKIDKDGVMSLDSTQLNSALSANLQSVSDVFSSSEGVATRLDSKLKNFLQSGGALDVQQNSLKKRLASFDDRKNDVQSRMDSLQKSLLKQFTAMDVAVGQFRNTGSFLSSWVSKL